jgi:putative ABC transport system substrate-binding protein
MMKRRGFTQLLAGAAIVPSAAYAQGNLEAPKVGYVYTGPRQIAAGRVDAVVSGIRASGHPLPQVEMVVRITEGDPANLAPMVAEVMAKKVSVFLANGPAALRVAQAASKTLPIVAIDFETDPVVAGYAQSIARPGGNVTGVFLDFPNFAGKWIELLLECRPRLSRIAMMWDPGTGPVQVDAVTKTAAALNIQTDLLETKVRADYTGAFAVAKDRGAVAVIMLSSPLVPASVKDLAELSIHHQLPAITMFSEFPRTGGLFSYGPNLVESTKQIGTMAGKVLGGTAPANLPIERPIKFELVVNLKAAEALSITMPASIQVRADEVIE